MSSAIEDCTISGTSFNGHADGLYYDMVVTANGIQQYHNGNDWSSANTTWDAYYNGSFGNILPTQYKVDNSLLANTNKISVNGGGNTNNWFVIESGTELSCQTQTDCGETPYEDGITEITSESLNGNDYWAIDSLDDEYYEAIHWDARRYLYEKLIKYPDLLNEATDVEDFYNEMEAGNIGKLFEIEDGLNNLLDPPSSISVAFNAILVTFFEQKDTIDAIDDLVVSVDSTERISLIMYRDSVVFEFESTIESLSNYLDTIIIYKNLRISDLQTINNSVSPSNSMESYAKAIQEIYLSALYDEDFDFTDEQKDIIDSVAGLCPIIGGGAVYDARGLQEYYQVPIWNDCPLIGDRSTPITSGLTYSGFKIYPNPASNSFKISFETMVPADSKLTILDLMGRIVMIVKLPEGSLNWQIPLSDLADGTYLINVNLGTDSYFNKLNIVQNK